MMAFEEFTLLKLMRSRWVSADHRFIREVAAAVVALPWPSVNERSVADMITINLDSRAGGA